MKSVKNIIKNINRKFTVTVVLIITILIIISVNSYSELSYGKKINKHFLVFYTATNDYYDKFCTLPQSINQIDSLVIYELKKSKYFKNLEILSNKDSVLFNYSYSSILLRQTLIRNLFKISPVSFSVRMEGKPILRYRFFKEGANNEKIIKEIENKISIYNKKYRLNNNQKNIFIYDKKASIIIYYNNDSEYYYYYSNYYIDSIGDNYLFDIKNQVSGILKKENIKKIEIPLILPSYYPVPPPNYN
jgi:hypothetical protein